MNHIIFPQFPNSQNEPFLETSPHTPTYNCIAWAFGDNTRWYWPDPEHLYYWPIGVIREISLEAFIILYKSIGYQICESDDFDINLEKIAIFIDSNNLPTHAARPTPLS